MIALTHCSAESDEPSDDEPIDALDEDTQALSSNLLTNPGFESSLSTGWRNFNSKAVRSSSADRNGTYGLRVNGQGVTNSVSVPAIPGVKYIATGYSRRASSSGSSYTNLNLIFETPTGTTVAQAVTGKWVAASSSWQKMTTSGVAPSKATGVYVQINYGQTSSVAYDWDDISLRSCRVNYAYCSVAADCCSGSCVQTGQYKQCVQ